MGSYLATAEDDSEFTNESIKEEHPHVSNQINSKLKALADEITLKRNQRTILFVGNSNSGKTTIINNIIDCYASTRNRHEFKRSRYDLELFTIREYTDPSISHYSSACFRYLHLIHEFPEYYTRKQQKNIDAYLVATQMILAESDSDNGNLIFRNGVLNSKYDEPLVIGFIRSVQIENNITFPEELKAMILMFVADVNRSIVNSYKIKVGDTIYNLWDTSGNDFLCLNVTQLYPWVDDVIFVLDLMRLSERDKNFLDITLFQAMKDDIDVNYATSFLNNDKGVVMVILNKKDRFQQKLMQMTSIQFKLCVGKISINPTSNDLDRYYVALHALKEAFGREIGDQNAFAQNEKTAIWDITATNTNDVEKLFVNYMLSSK